MRTSKPIATISYNSQEFLILRLNELVENHKVCDWIFINHFPEEDERKAHIHLWIKPNTLIDTMDLQKYFEELDPKNPTKKLKCIDFRSSQVDDFILYGMHLEQYLITKGQSREYHYTRDDFVYCDEDSFLDLYNHALKGSEWAQRNQQLQIIKENMINPAQLVYSGVVPFNQTSQLSSLAFLSGTNRNGRKGHEENED